MKRRENQPREANEELEVYQSLTGLIVESIGQTRDDPANNIDAGKRYTCTITSDELGSKLKKKKEKLSILLICF